MTSLFHALNISTLATWLSVTGLGTVGMAVPLWHGPAGVFEDQAGDLIPQELPDIVLGDYYLPGVAEDAGIPAETMPAETMPAELPAEPSEETLHPEPPEIPQWEEVAELPEIPELPARPRASADFVKPSKPAVVSQAPRPKTTARSGASRSGGVAGGSGLATGAQASTRLAAGRMPSPRYPLEARRKNQSGTVLVEFTVDGSGRVISAVAKSPSPWPLLNQEAVRTVRTWRFPPGPVMKLQRPIVFQLR